MDALELRFDRSRRLTTAAQFGSVFKRNRKVADRYWTVLYRHNDFHHARLGMAVAKKRARRAVDRNRLRRLIRESFRHNVQLPGIDVVILPRDAATGADSETLRRSLAHQWQLIIRQCEKSSAAS